MSNVYSGIDKLPKGYASDKVTKGCLVLEGGAFRCIYEEGIIDLFQQRGINFECVIGVSAGAMNGINYTAGQIGRSARINLRYRHDPNYVGVKPLFTDGGVIGFDYIFGDLPGVEPLDYTRLFDKKWRMVCTATDVRTGKPVYFEKNFQKDFLQCIRASASMPFISQPVPVNDGIFLDGGCSCNIPYQWAIDEGYEKIVVIKSRASDYRDSPMGLAQKRVIDRLYRDYPEFAEALKNMNDRYNRELDELDYLGKTGRLFVMAPSEPLEIGRLEPDMEKLGGIYHLGRKDMLKRWKEFEAYMGDALA